VLDNVEKRFETDIYIYMCIYMCIHQKEFTPKYGTKSIIYGGTITMGHTYEIEATKSKGTRIGLLELIRHTCKDNIKSNLKELSPGCRLFLSGKYRVIKNDCRGFNNLSYTIHLR
jgi:hypothetical protein